jgi:type II secretory ATPase GspE/PulE/Tfp pilus assembly ATPase PilB-like protein
VFSTLHTNDAPGATTRLIDMGIEPYLVSSSVEAIIAQRLVRLICKNCKAEMPEHELRLVREEFGDEIVPPVLWKGTGCRQCQGSGYRGRQGIFEMMLMSDEVRSLILERAPSHLIRRVATKEGMRSLREDGWRLVREGLTTVDEVMRNTKDEASTIAAYSSGTEGEALRSEPVGELTSDGGGG